jgi:ribosome-binding protein aMBF1 (putative translation factor)
MDKRPDFKSFKEEVLKNPKVRAEYEALRPEFEVIMGFIKARKAKRLSQATLAKKLKIQQSSIARLENGGYAKTSIANLARFADKMGYSLKVSLQAKKNS